MMAAEASPYIESAQEEKEGHLFELTNFVDTDSVRRLTGCRRRNGLTRQAFGTSHLNVK